MRSLFTPIRLLSAARVPSIKFLGKRSRLPVSGAPGNVASKGISPQSPPAAKVASTAVAYSSLKGGAWYGRPALTPAEIAAIESGGATYMLL
jgi:hypothetical protein